MLIPAEIEWLEPWTPESDEDGLLANELRREVCDHHILFGINVRAVGRRIDCDDVLFVTDDPQKPIAVVHLTWRIESDRSWPWSALVEMYQ